MQHIGSLGCDHISGSVKNPFIWNTGGGYTDNVDVGWIHTRKEDRFISRDIWLLNLINSSSTIFRCTLLLEMED